MKDIVPVERIVSKIYLIRERKVMMDRDLAELYGVQTAQLKRAVRRNIERFPDDFMFELTKQELKDWRCQFGTSNGDKMGLRYTPMFFTEQGVAMIEVKEPKTPYGKRKTVRTMALFQSASLKLDYLVSN